MDDLQAGFDEKVAVVTGAARGAGEAISRRLASLGMRVILLARDRERLQGVLAGIEQLGGRGEVYPCDLRDERAIDGLGSYLRQKHGRCDVLVNNAAVGQATKPLHELSVSEWDDLMATNLRGPFLMIRALAPLMIEWQSGHIINISSLVGKNPFPNGAAYSASKFGLNGLTYSLAEELRKENVRVSVVAPGSINTGFGGKGDPGEFKEEAWKIQPDDLADVVEMLVRQPAQSFVSEVLIRPTRKS
jgi:3-oxoacyl-[acyl-carrier protein] reductase